MQRRNFKDAMNEMCDHTVAKIQEHAETLSRLDKEEKGKNQGWILNGSNVEVAGWYCR